MPDDTMPDDTAPQEQPTQEQPAQEQAAQEQAPQEQAAIPQVFQQTNYLVRKKILKMVGAAFHIYDPSGNVAFYSKQKAFKLKEDIRVYTGEDMQTEVLTILARQIIDFSAAYDVVDPTTNVKVGALKRKGMKSIVRDEWIIMDAQDREIGLIQEDSTAACSAPPVSEHPDPAEVQRLGERPAGLPLQAELQSFRHQDQA